MPPYALIIDGVSFDPTVPPEAVQRTGGGREIREWVSVTGKIIRSQGHRTARRVRIASPDAGFVLLASQVEHLKSLEAREEPFTVTLGSGYEVSGTFEGCWLEGDAVFEPKRGLTYRNYDFTLYLPQ